MKKQDIAALIDGKIKGQGSAIDIGNALPAILGGLNDNSVAEDMEETEQMQLRKELGLYYEETTEEEKQAQYDAETSYIVADYSTARLTEDVPEPEYIVDVLYEGEHVDFTVTEKQFGGFAVKVGKGLSPDMFFDVRETAQNPIFPTPGVWITITEYPHPEKYTLVYKASETVVSKVPEKFLPEMGDEVEGNPEVPGGTSPTALRGLRINENYFSIPQLKAVVLTDIPFGPTMTQSALDAIGLTTSEVEAAARGYRTGCIVGGNFRLICAANFTDANNYLFAVATPLGDALSYWFLVSCEAGVITVTNA